MNSNLRLVDGMNNSYNSAFKKQPNKWDAYVDDLLSAAKALIRLLHDLNDDGHFSSELMSSEFDFLDVLGHEPLFAIQNRLVVIAYLDGRNCFEKLGHSLQDLNNLEGLGFGIFLVLLIMKEFDESNFYNRYTRTQITDLTQKFDKFFSGLPLGGVQKDVLVFDLVFGNCQSGHKWTQQYTSLLYRWASLVAKADGVVTDQERLVLESIMRIAEPSADSGMNHSGIDVLASDARNAVRGFQKATHSPSVELMRDDGGVGCVSLESLLRSLDDLIGLEPVKKEVHNLVNYIQIVQRRKEAGLKTAPISSHCVFTGNPGTGKTTVARILAGIYRALGVIKKGHLVETDRAGLVAEFLGQTAVKTNKLVDKALDGVLFIDEAYSLIARDGGPQDPYGREAVDTLLRRMENDRDRLVVIVAGYPDEMKQFIDSNPGLQSRFNRYIGFPDYSAEELARIFLLHAEESQYDCNEEVRNSLVQIMEYAISQNDENFGNGRYVRNLFEKSIQRQAVRLSGVAPLTSEMLSELTLHDLGFSYEA